MKVNNYGALEVAQRPLDDAPGLVELEDANSATERSIDELPAEVFVKIFGYLEQKELLSTARVCRRWENIIRTHKTYMQPKNGQTAVQNNPTPSQLERGERGEKRRCCMTKMQRIVVKYIAMPICIVTSMMVLAGVFLPD